MRRWMRRPRIAKAARGTQTGSSDLAVQARMIASAQRGLAGAAVPDPVREAMADQGMGPGTALGPGQPMEPRRSLGESPQVWALPPGYNLAARPRHTRSRASFETLRAILESYDVARVCIEHRQDDVRSLDWRITSADDAHGDVDDAVAAATRFMAKPDGVTPFDGWQNALLHDVLAYDAGALYRRRNRRGDVIGLEVVDGTTIVPLLDARGSRPQAPAPAYAQWVHGRPEVWLTEQELIYQPFRTASNSPYGLSPLEYMLLTINADIRHQYHFLSYFTEGSTPAVFMQAPADLTDPGQLAELQAWWDAAMEGDSSQKRKVKWVPAGSNPVPYRDEGFAVDFPKWLLTKTCAAFKVKPSDLGFIDDVNRSNGEVQAAVQKRVGRRPLLRYLAGIYTAVLQEDLGLPVKFVFQESAEEDDGLLEAQRWKLLVEAGAASPDEMRAAFGLPVDALHPVPRYVSTGRGLVPLAHMFAAAGPGIDPATGVPRHGQVTGFLDPAQAAAVQAGAEQEPAPGPPALP